MRWIHALVPSTAVFLLSLPAPCQEVVSAYAGTIHFLEGAGFLDDKPLDHRPAVFPVIKNGSTFRTQKGRAEVLLTPGAVLRVDDDSSIRMVSNTLTDTRVEFLKGAVILDTQSATASVPVVLLYQRFQVRFPKQGIYRLDADTGVLQAYAGEAKVLAPEGGKTSTVDASRLFFFDLGMLTNKFGEPNEDEFYDWARGRADTLSAENQLAEENEQDALSPDNSPYIWNTPVPYSGSYPSYSALDSTYLPGSVLNPLFAFGGGPGVPFGVWPVVVLHRRELNRELWQHQHWPHRPSPAFPVTGPSRIGVSQLPLRAPVIHPRPVPNVGAMRAPRPVTVAPRPVAPAGARPILHR